MSAYITSDQTLPPEPRKRHGGASLEDYQAAAQQHFEKEQAANTVRATSEPAVSFWRLVERARFRKS